MMNDPIGIKCYSDLRLITDYLERYQYLKMSNGIGLATFGFDRYLNQHFYKTREWRHSRRDVIIRDLGNDLGVEGYDIHGTILVHHMNPITIDDLKNRTKFLLDPEYLISTRLSTHSAIHYGDESLLISSSPIERSPNDTKLW